MRPAGRTAGPLRCSSSGSLQLGRPDKMLSMLNIPAGITERKKLMMKVCFWLKSSRAEEQLSQKCVMVVQTPLFSCMRDSANSLRGCGWIFFFLLVPVELKGCFLLPADVTVERLLWGLRGRPRSCVLRINSIKIIRTVCILLENSVEGSQRLFSTD